MTRTATTHAVLSIRAADTDNPMTAIAIPTNHAAGEAHSTLHAPQYNGAGGYGQKYATVDLSQDFHIWTAEWDGKGIKFLLNGDQVCYASKATVEATRGPWIFGHPFSTILNLAVGGDFPGPIDATTPFPARMRVDYVWVHK